MPGRLDVAPERPNLKFGQVELGLATKKPYLQTCL